MKSLDLLCLIVLATFSTKYSHASVPDKPDPPAVIGQFPYKARLLFEGLSGCGGSLIDSQWIVTAAHCVYGKKWVIVYLGSINKDEGEIAQLLNENSFFIHEAYDEISHYNDIALISISKVKFYKNVEKIALPKKKKLYPTYIGIIAYMTGWTRISDSNGVDADILKYSEMIVISNDECAKNNTEITPENICTKPISTQGCSVDSGGPLVIKSSKILIGIASYGTERCLPNQPRVFTRVTSYLDWIANKTGIDIS